MPSATTRFSRMTSRPTPSCSSRWSCSAPKTPSAHGSLVGRFLLVTLAEDLAAQGTTHNVAMLSIQHCPGVHDVVDLSAIGPETLALFLGVDHTRQFKKKERRSPLPRR